MSATARKYATQHQYGPANPTAKTSTVRPNNTEPGSCGTSFIYIHPWGRYGEADANYGFHSTDGTVIYRSLNMHWDNLTNGLGGNHPDVGVMASSSLNHWHTINTGQGWVEATLAGYVKLRWGGTCYLKNPSDEKWVKAGD